MGNRPRCLHLFSGPEREGDLAQQLVGKGWAVCSVDLEQPTPTNLLDQAIRQLIISDVDNEMFDHIHLGTPCETFSPLRENPPGPKPLRSASQVEGLKEGLNQKEIKQLKEGNEHVAFSGDVMGTAHQADVSFALENPEPLKEVSMFNMPKIKVIAGLDGVSHVDFDQCRFGAETQKPTRFLCYKVKHEKHRCNHPKKEWKGKDGKAYMASHERLVGRKRIRDGKEEYASKALGNYPSRLCKAMAEDIAKVNTKRARLARGLPSEELP